MLHASYMTNVNAIMVYFNGPVCQDMVESIGQVMRRKMAAQNHTRPMMQRVFAVLVEQMQNIVHYGESPDPDLPQGQIVVYRENGEIHVSSGNAMSPARADHLRRTIDAINKLNSQELKMLYKQQRREPAPPSSKGAGLGLLEMARKSGKPMSYSFCRQPGDHVYFSVDVRIDEEVC